MYKMCPPAVFAHESVMKHGTYRARVARVVEALTEPHSIETQTHFTSAPPVSAQARSNPNTSMVIVDCMPLFIPGR